MSAHGLINTFHGVNMTYKADANKPCVPTTYELVTEEDMDHWWGDIVHSGASGPIIGLDKISCMTGNMQPLRSYYCQNYIGKEGVSPFPELMQKMHIYNLENSMNNPTVEWSYKPQLCLLKAQLPLYPFVTTDSYINYGCKPIGFRKYKLNVNTDATAGESNVSLSTEVDSKVASTTDTTDYYSYIEHIGSAAHGFAEFGGGLFPPSLHVGCLPVHSYSSSPTDDDIQDITVIYKIDTMCEVEYSFDFIYADSNQGNAHCLTTGDPTFIKINKQIVNAYGYKTMTTSETPSVATSRPGTSA